MHISYFGLSCFKVVAKTAGRGSDDVTVLFAPFATTPGLRAPQGKADVVLYPHPAPLFCGGSYTNGDPVEIRLPGEYAIEGMNIIGRDAPADPREGADRGNTVVYILDLEGMKLVYLGALGGDLSPDLYEQLSGADILFLPIGDNNGLDGKTAETVARKIEPRVIIPMQYTQGKTTLPDLRDQHDFCSNIGNCPNEDLDKYVVKASDLENTSMHVVTLSIV